MTEENNQTIEQPVVEKNNTATDDILALKKQLSDVLETNKKLASDQAKLAEKLERGRGFGDYTGTSVNSTPPKTLNKDFGKFVPRYSAAQHGYPDNYIDNVGNDLGRELFKIFQTNKKD